MNYYGPTELAASFRTVRKNTLAIAEEIPEEKYSYRPAEGVRTIAEILTHIAFGAKFQEQVIFIEKRTSMEGFDFFKYRDALMADLNKPRSKAEIIALLNAEGEKYAQAVESLSDEFVGQSIMMPPDGPPWLRCGLGFRGSNGA
jgi:aspartate/tyrosine/aromatic aminotransferase